MALIEGEHFYVGRTSLTSTHLAGYMNTGIPGLARDYWPAGISTRVDMSEDPAALETIPCSLEGVAENVVIEPYKKQGTDRSRRLGIFSSKHAEQTHFSVKFHGFIKREELKGYGNWNGLVAVLKIT